MAKHSLEDRRADVERRATEAENRGVEYRAREARYRGQGKVEKADAAATTARRQESIAANHRRTLTDLDIRLVSDRRERAEAEKIQAEMRQRVERERKPRPRPDSLQIFTEALQAAVEIEEAHIRRDKAARGYRRAGEQAKADLVAKRAARDLKQATEWRKAAADEFDRARDVEGRDLRREHALALKAAERHQGKAHKEADRLGHMNVETNIATAAAQREIRPSGGRGKRVASMATYSELLRRTQDRTLDRLKAMQQFDELCGRADAGLLPEPRFERESGSGKGPGDAIMAARTDGLREMEALTSAIGAGNARLLRLRIYERRTLTAIVREGIGTETTIAQLFLAAVDAVTVYDRTKSALAAVTAGMGLPVPIAPAPVSNRRRKVEPVEHDPAMLAYRHGNPEPTRWTWRR